MNDTTRARTKKEHERKELADNLERLGLSQYLDRFCEEGFESWENVLYIAESDLDALQVKLGHRRRLQREVAQVRNVSFESLIPQIGAIGGAPDVHWITDSSRQSTLPLQDRTNAAGGSATKRKYRRHPKADENAPDRPPSAYVIFSNVIREEVKFQKLSFTEIAKTVGERWQNLSADEKKSFEKRATTMKEEYHARLAQYKRTKEFTEYQQYLEDFKAKNNASNTDIKRTKVDKDVPPPPRSRSAGSVSSSPSLSAAPGITMSQGVGREAASSAYLHSPATSVHPSPVPTLSMSISSNPGGEVSSPGSTSAAPLAGATYLPPRGGQESTYQPTRLQSLPRLVPMEPPREDPLTSTNLPPIITDSSRQPYSLRRTTGSPHVALLHHDTSRSSDFSSTSTNSTLYTPSTPVEETRPFHAAPSNALIASGYHTPTTRSQLWSVPTHPVAPEPMVSRDSAGQSFHQLSISGRHYTDKVSSEGPQSPDTSAAGVNRTASVRGGGMDALSVLALAGHMVDLEQSSQLKPKTSP